MSSIEWFDAQLRFLIDERKQRNSEYHAIPNKKKRDFWKDIANKLNERENTNYFTGEDCHKKFLSLTKAFYVSITSIIGGIKDITKLQYYFLDHGEIAKAKKEKLSWGRYI